MGADRDDPTVIACELRSAIRGELSAFGGSSVSVGRSKTRSSCDVKMRSAAANGIGGGPVIVVPLACAVKSDALPFQR